MSRASVAPAAARMAKAARPLRTGLEHLQLQSTADGRQKHLRRAVSNDSAYAVRDGPVLSAPSSSAPTCADQQGRRAA
jgi:hypothetical protein